MRTKGQHTPGGESNFPTLTTTGVEFSKLRSSTLRLALLGAVLITAGTGVVQTWNHLGSMNGDGVSYLDIGETVLSGNLAALFNGYWGPLYGVLAATAERMASRAGLPAFAGAQLLNLAIFFLNLWLYLRLVSSLVTLPSVVTFDRTGRFAIHLFASGVFALITAKVNPVSLVTPDLLLSAVYLAAMRLAIGALEDGFSFRGSCGLGLLFGIGYWIKSIAFPMALGWFALLLIVRRRQASVTKYVAAAAFCWVIVVMPLAIGISNRVGHLTISDNGRLNYLWYMNRLPNRLWLGSADGHGTPVHAPRRILSDPLIVGFDDVMPTATYPLWFDPSHWYKGAIVRFDLQQQLDAIADNLASQRGMWLNRAMAPFCLIAIAGCILGRQYLSRSSLTFLFASSCLPFLILIPVHTEPRFFTASVLCLLIATAIAAVARYPGVIRRPLGWSGAAGLLTVSCWIVAYTGAIAEQDQSPLRTAQALRSLKVLPGEKICLISETSNAATYAKAAQLRVSAQMPLAAYRILTARNIQLPSESFDAFRSAGCVAVVADLVPGDRIEPGWLQVPGEFIWIRRLSAVE